MHEILNWVSKNCRTHTTPLEIEEVSKMWVIACHLLYQKTSRVCSDRKLSREFDTVAWRIPAVYYWFFKDGMLVEESNYAKILVIWTARIDINALYWHEDIWGTST